MFSFSGHLREEEDRTVTGTNWTSDGYECPYPCIAGQTATLGSPSRPKQGIVSRRIDMAAMINENHADATELPDELIDLEATDNTQETKADDSDESDLKSTSSEKTVFFCGPFFCSPCVCRLWCLGFTLFALFVIGLGVGLRQRDEPTNKTSASALNSGVSVSMPGDDPPSLAPQQEQQGDQQQQQQGDQQNPTSYPTPSFDFDFEIDYDDAIVNEDSTGVVQEWDTSGSPYLVGVYYYPWHGSNFHNGEGYVRKFLMPQHQPALGEYDDTRPEVIAQHIQWSRQANIGLWITSWWGPNGPEDNTTRNVIMSHEQLGDLMIAVHYETANRVQTGLTGVSSDMEYMCANYFDHPNYYKVDGRPVLFIYVTRMLQDEGILEPTILTMRTSASKCGHDVFLVGDQVFDSAPVEGVTYNPFLYFDAVTNYDVYGSAGRPSPYAGFDAVDNYYTQQEAWRTSAHNSGCRYIPAVSPGYNDRGVRYENNHPPLSRKLTGTSPEGSLFSYQLSRAKPLVDPLVDNLLVVNSFNEWHEDTQIEPAVGERTNLPFNLTGGIYYEGYGDLYLNILRESTLQ